MFNKILLILALISTPILSMKSMRVDCDSAPSFLEKAHGEHQYINNLHNSQLLKASRFVQKAENLMSKVCSDTSGDILLQSRSKLDRDQNMMRIKSLHSDLTFIPVGENQAQKAIHKNLATVATSLLQVESRRSEACLKAKIHLDRHTNVVSLIQHHHAHLKNNINTLNSFIQACSLQDGDTQVITLPQNGDVNQAITGAADADECKENCDNVEIPDKTEQEAEQVVEQVAEQEAVQEAETNTEAITENYEGAGQTESTTPESPTVEIPSTGTEENGGADIECECRICPCEDAGDSTTIETPIEPAGQTESVIVETPAEPVVETPVEPVDTVSECECKICPCEDDGSTTTIETTTEAAGQTESETPTATVEIPVGPVETTTPTVSECECVVCPCENTGGATETITEPAGQTESVIVEPPAEPVVETPVEPVDTVSECKCYVCPCEDDGSTTTIETTTEPAGQTESVIVEPPAQPVVEIPVKPVDTVSECECYVCPCASSGDITIGSGTESAQAPTEVPVSQPAVPSTPVATGDECIVCSTVGGTTQVEEPVQHTEVIIIPAPAAQTETIVPTSTAVPVPTQTSSTSCECAECVCEPVVTQQPTVTETVTSVTETIVPVDNTGAGQTETIIPVQTPSIETVPVSVPAVSQCVECDSGVVQVNGGSSGQASTDVPVSIGTVSTGNNGGCDGCAGGISFGIDLGNAGNNGNNIGFALRGSGQ